MSYFDDVSGLCQTPGPSGFEDPAAEKAARLLAPLVDELKVDRLGSVIGVRRCGKPGAKKVLLDAHLDEVGLIVTGHKEGFLQMRTLGGIDPRVLADRELTVLSDPPMLGVVAVKPPHIMAAGEADDAVPIRDLWLDVGLTQEQAEKAAPVGTPIVYREETFRLGESLIAGKSLDDRSCFAILLRTLELLKGEELDVDVAVLGSCFEETSGDGALVATFAQDPDCAIAVDVTFAKTHDDKDTGFELGSGPAVGIGPNCARWMVSLLKKAAAEAGAVYLSTCQELYASCVELQGVFLTRNRIKKAAVAEGQTDRQIFVKMQEEQPVFILIDDLADFIQAVSHPDEGVSDMSRFFGNITDKGSLHNIYFIAAFNPEEAGSMIGSPIYQNMIRDRQGIHFGGNVTSQRLFTFDYISYTQQTKPKKPGLGLLPSGDEETDRHEVVVPLAE